MDSALTGATQRAFEDIHTAGVTGSIPVSPTQRRPSAPDPITGASARSIQNCQVTS
jgi:hypothetical protein